MKVCMMESLMDHQFIDAYQTSRSNLDQAIDYGSNTSRCTHLIIIKLLQYCRAYTVDAYYEVQCIRDRYAL
jgi:hypothetical protein